MPCQMPLVATFRSSRLGNRREGSRAVGCFAGGRPPALQSREAGSTRYSCLTPKVVSIRWLLEESGKQGGWCCCGSKGEGMLDAAPEIHIGAALGM